MELKYADPINNKGCTCMFLSPNVLAQVKHSMGFSQNCKSTSQDLLSRGENETHSTVPVSILSRLILT